MTSGPFTAASPSPCRNNNYDFTLRYERIKLFERVLHQFDANMKRTSQAMRDLATCFSHIGDSYEEVALCVSYATGGSAATATAISQRKAKAKSGTATKPSCATALQDQESLQTAAKMFCTEVKRMREGDCYVQFNEGVHKDVLGRLDEVHVYAKKAVQIGERADEALKKLNKARTIVDKKVAKYQRLNRPLTDSKRYVKQKKAMDDAEAMFDSKAALFDEAYQTLMQTKLSTTGTSIDSFLDLNLTYLCHLLQILGCLAPNGARIVDDMVEGARRLGQRIGVPEENLVASAVHPSRVGQNGRSRSAHNFTSFYRNRKDGQAAGSPQRAGDAPEMDTRATRNNRDASDATTATAAAAAGAKKEVRRARSPSARDPHTDGAAGTGAAVAAPHRAAPCEPRPAAAPAAAAALRGSQVEAQRGSSHAPYGDTPNAQHQNRRRTAPQQPPQQARAAPGQEPPATVQSKSTTTTTSATSSAAPVTPTAPTVTPQVHARPITAPPVTARTINTTTTTPAATPSPALSARTPAAAAAATREPSHEPFDDHAASSVRRPVARQATAASAAAPAAVVVSHPPVERDLFTNGTHVHDADEEDDPPMRPTTATTLFDFPSVPSVSTATPVSSQWATRNRASGPFTSRSRRPVARAAAHGPSAPPDDDETGSVSAPSSVRGQRVANAGARPAQREFQPINAFVPASCPATGDSGSDADETEGRPTVSPSRLVANRGEVRTQPVPHWVSAGARPSISSIPELPAKGSPSSASGQHSPRSDAFHALTPAGATSGTATPTPGFDWGHNQSQHGAADGEGLVFVSWGTPKEDEDGQDAA